MWLCREDFEEAQRLVRSGDTKAMAAFLSRNVEAQAERELAASAHRFANRGHSWESPDLIDSQAASNHSYTARKLEQLADSLGGDTDD